MKKIFIICIVLLFCFACKNKNTYTTKEDNIVLLTIIDSIYNIHKIGQNKKNNSKPSIGINKYLRNQKNIDLKNCIEYSSINNLKPKKISGSIINFNKLQSKKFNFYEIKENQQKDKRLKFIFSKIKYINNFAFVNSTIINSSSEYYILKRKNNKWEIICIQGLSIM